MTIINIPLTCSQLRLIIWGLSIIGLIYSSFKVQEGEIIGLDVPVMVLSIVSVVMLFSYQIAVWSFSPKWPSFRCKCESNDG